MSSERFGSNGALEQLPRSLQYLLTLERFHLHRLDLFQNPDRDPAFDTRYFPQNCAAFPLPCFWVPRKYLYVYGKQAEADSELRLFEGHDLEERVLFPIHPHELPHYTEFLQKTKAHSTALDGLCVWAVPTSSTRTLLAWPDGKPEQALFLKTSLKSPIFGDRNIYRRKVASGVGLSRLVKDSQTSLPPELSYLFEPVGFIPRTMPNSGVLVRTIPPEVKAGRVFLAPMFSLLGGSEGHRPLLLTLVEHNETPLLELLEELLCAQFAQIWLRMCMQFGLLLEAHGQDLMLALSPELKPLQRFYYRDFEGLQVDWELRRAFGLPEPQHLPHCWSWYETYASWGHRFCGLAWYKIRVSLFDYFYFILNELDESLHRWQETGQIGGPKIKSGTMTSMFSGHLVHAIQKQFGYTLSVQEDIYQGLHKFIVQLMLLRRELIRERRLPNSQTL